VVSRPAYVLELETSRGGSACCRISARHGTEPGSVGQGARVFTTAVVGCDIAGRCRSGATSTQPSADPSACRATTPFARQSRPHAGREEPLTGEHQKHRSSDRLRRLVRPEHANSIWRRRLGGGLGRGANLLETPVNRAVFPRDCSEELLQPTTPVLVDGVVAVRLCSSQGPRAAWPGCGRVMPAGFWQRLAHFVVGAYAIRVGRH
jgi:hypothetical protein